MRKTLLSLTLLAASASALATQGYYRSPAIHGDTIVFTAEGDLWKGQLGQTKATRMQRWLHGGCQSYW